MSSNPVFKSKSYQAAAKTGGIDATPMTYADVIHKTTATFGVVLVGAIIGWQIPDLAIVGALVGFVLAMVNIFKKRPSPPLILAYAAAEGLFLGGITAVFEVLYPGIAIQAVLATGVVFGVTLTLYRSGKYRATPKLTKMFFVAMIAYGVFSLVNLGLMIFGVTDGMFGVRSGWFGLAIGALAILLATYALVLDFTEITENVDRFAPKELAWRAAFGLTVTLVWLYLEILRILAILRGD